MLTSLLLTITLVVLTNTKIYAQKEASIWYFGTNAGLDFNTTPPTPLDDGKTNTLEGCASIADKNGNLLFYIGATGPKVKGKLTVWDKNHKPMPKGDGTLIGDVSATQAAVILPAPSKPNLYYVFTVDSYKNANFTTGEIPPNEGIHYSTIDMSLNNGSGDVVELNKPLLKNTAEKVTAVKSTQGFYWVIVYANNKESTIDYNTLFAFKLTESGVDSNPVTSPAGITNSDGRGSLKFSSDGNKLAITTVGNKNPFKNMKKDFVLYNFDPSTGKASKLKDLSETLQKDEQPYGIEFSLNNRFLYVSTYEGGSEPSKTKVIQYDLEGNYSRVIIDETPDRYRGVLQMGIDGRIYKAVSKFYSESPLDTKLAGTDYLDIINAPNEKGNACNYQKKGIKLKKGTFSQQGLPPFVQSFFNTEIINVDVCLGNISKLELSSFDNLVKIDWDFGDDSPIVSSQEFSIEHLYTEAGTYTVTADVTTTSENKEFHIKHIVWDLPKINPDGDDIYICDNDGDGKYNVNLNDYLGELQEGVTLSFYKSENNAIDKVNEITDVPYTTSNNEVIYVRVENTQAEDCFNIGKVITVHMDSPPQLSDLPEFSICDNYQDSSDGIGEFDLELYKENIIDLLDGSYSYTIEYYKSEADAENSTNPLPMTYVNTYSKQQTIYVRIEYSNSTTCSTTKPLVLKVVNAPDLEKDVVLEQCDDNSDGFMSFNLNDAKEKLLGNSTGSSITFYTSYENAENKVNKVQNPEDYTNKTAGLSKIWVNAGNPNFNCDAIAELTLKVISTKIPESFMMSYNDCEEPGQKIPGVGTFNITLAKAEIEKLFPNPDVINISYYRSPEDAESQTNPITDFENYQNTGHPNHQMITVRVEGKGASSCLYMGEHIELTVNPSPTPPDLNSDNFICLNEEENIIEASNVDNNLNYTWYNENGDIIGNESFLTINKGGFYKVTVKNPKTECENSSSITVKESQESLLTTADLDITQFDPPNSISIPTGTSYGIGDYVYSLEESGEYSKKAYFEDLDVGNYTLYVKDLNGCKLHEVPFTILDYMRFFTPNGDGDNDFWKLKSGDLTLDGKIYIYDRFGKFLKELDPNEQGWDGNYNGIPLPSTDYWFSVELIDGTTKKAHFSLIRR